MDAENDFESRAAFYEGLWEKAYDEQTPRHLPSSDITFKELLSRNRRERGDELHVIYGDRQWTWKESDTWARRIANALVDLGIRKGDRVLVALSNRPAVIFCRMACMKIGAISVGLNPRCTMREMERNLVDSGAKAAFVDFDALPKLNEVRAEHETNLERIIVVAQPEGKRDHLELLDIAKAASESEPEADVGPDDILTLSYTGGTTGVSKGCCYTNRMLEWHARAWNTWFAPQLKGERPRLLVSLPMYHAYAITCSVMLPIVTGGTVIVGTSPSVDDIIADINRFKPNIWPSIPAWVMPVSQRSDVEGSGLSDVAITLCGTCPVSEDALQKFNDVTESLMIEGYGLSEATSCVSFSPMGWQKLNSVGIPICDTQVLTVDVETGENLTALGEAGEIIVRGPQVIKEYWNHPEATASTIRNGWLYTGDIGTIDEDGFLRITGRKKEMFIVGGFNVFPREIDKVVESHPGVFQSCTVSVPHERLGEVAFSFVVPNPDADIDGDELDAYCREQLVAYKAPKGFAILEELPLTSVNKPDVLTLKKWAAERYRASGDHR